MSGGSSGGTRTNIQSLEERAKIAPGLAHRFLRTNRAVPFWRWLTPPNHDSRTLCPRVQDEWVLVLYFFVILLSLRSPPFSRGGLSGASNNIPMIIYMMSCKPLHTPRCLVVLLFPFPKKAPARSLIAPPFLSFHIPPLLSPVLFFCLIVVAAVLLVVRRSIHGRNFLDAPAA